MALTIDQLTAATLDGNGAFDVLMRANKAHLEDQFSKQRVKGAEYAQVYLGSLQAVLQTALTFLLQRDKLDLESQLLQKQIELAQVQIDKAEAELAIIQAQLPKTQAETALLQAQTAKVDQEKINLVAEALNIPKQGALLDAQEDKVIQETANLVSQKLHIEAETDLTAQKVLNAVIEGTVLTQQECKLRAEYDVLLLTKAKVTQETDLLLWKVTTEKAQTTATGVDENSVVGRQKTLYLAQANGFTRDAEQKATKIMVDSWNVRRTTDEATSANGTNMLDDTAVGRVVTKLLTGIGA